MNTLSIWSIEPDWTNGLTETLEWKTAVLQSHSGAEQRIAQRLSPRRTFEFSILTAGKERQQFENWLCYLGGSELFIPIFSDVFQLQTSILAGQDTLSINTLGRDIYPGCQLLIKSGFGFAQSAVVTVNTVIADSVTLTKPLAQAITAGMFIYPLRKAVLTDPLALERASDHIATAQVRLRISEHNQHSDNIDSLPVYRSIPVLNLAPDWSEPVNGKYDRLMLELDNGTGIPARTDSARRAFYLNTLQYEACGRSEHSQLRCILYYLRGRQKPIWVPSFSHDLNPVSNLINNVMDIDFIGYSLTGVNHGRRDVCILLTNGQQHYKRIISSAVLDNQTERLILDGEPLSVDKSLIVMVSFLTLSRLNSDSVQYQHLTDADGVATVTLEFLGVRDELE